MQHDILIVDDELDIRHLIGGVLEDEGFTVRAAKDSNDALAELSRLKASAVILDIWLQGSPLDGMDLLPKILEQYPDIPVIMISGHGSIETAVKAIKLGASDFIEKPIKLDRLLFVVEKVIENHKIKRDLTDLKARNSMSLAGYYIGQSAFAHHIRHTLEKVSQSDSRVLITGPSGSGKEVCARIIHQLSDRSSEPFVTLNCASIAPDTFEEVLFGTEPQISLHDDKPRSVGALERAHRGILLLDEVADIPYEIQGRFARILQQKRFARMGGDREVEIDIRIIATSQCDLASMVKEGLFREDLYYRLNVVPISLVPLRQRREDIELYADHFLQKCASDQGVAYCPLSDEAKILLTNYDWPGNIRQLKNALEWVFIMYSDFGSQILPRHLPPELTGMWPEEESIAGLGQHIFGLPLKEARDSFEKVYLQKQIERYGGNISKTAHFIGMERSALHRKLKSLNLDLKGIKTS